MEKIRNYGYLAIMLMVVLLCCQANQLYAEKKVELRTIRSLVPYEDLHKMLQQNVGKYFILPIEEFEELKAAKEESLQQIEPDKDPPPIRAQVESARFEGNIIDNYAQIDGYFRIRTFTDEWHEIPLIWGSIALQSAEVNGLRTALKITGSMRRKRNLNFGSSSPASQKILERSYSRSDTLMQSNWQENIFTLPLKGEGIHEVKISFLVPVETDDDVYNLEFALTSTPLVFTRLLTEGFSMIIEDTSFRDYSAFEKSGRDGKFIGWLGARRNFRISWRRKTITEERIEPEPEPKVIVEDPAEVTTDEEIKELVEVKKPEPEPVIRPVVYARSNSIISIDEDKIIGHKVIDYSIARAGVSSFSLLLPQGTEVINLSADRPHTSRQIRSGQDRILRVTFMATRQENCKIEITYQAPVDLTQPLILVPEITPLNIEREIGTTAIEAMASVEIQPGNTEEYPAAPGVFLIDPDDIPDILKERASRPVLMAFRHGPTPTNTLLAVKRYLDVEQKTIVADRMEVQTTFTTNQTSNTMLNINLRNNDRQYLRLVLASGSEILSSYANNRAVNPMTSSVGDQRQIQIPIEMSSQTGEPAETNLQILLRQPVSAMDWRGNMEFETPLIDVPISQISWHIYAPESYDLHNFHGTVLWPEQKDDMFFFRGFNNVMNYLWEIFRSPELVILTIIVLAIFMLILCQSLLVAIIKGIWNGIAYSISFIFKGKGIRLAELAIVIVVVVMLSAIATPNFRRARSQAREKACQANQCVLLGAVEMYNMDNVPMMKNLDQHKLGDYLRGGEILTCPTAPGRNTYYSRGNLSTGHGSIACEICGGIGDDLRKSAPSQIARERTAAPSTMHLADSIQKAKSTQPPPTDDFGARRVTGARAIRSQFVTTSNAYRLERFFVLPEFADDGSQIANATSPKVKFEYVSKNVMNGARILAFLLAFFGALYFVSGAVTKYKGKAILAAIIIILLSVVDFRLQSMGDSANTGFWTAIIFAFIYKTFYIIKVYIDAYHIAGSETQQEIQTSSGSIDKKDQPSQAKKESDVHNTVSKPLDEDKPDKPDKSDKSGKINIFLLLIIFAVSFSIPLFASTQQNVRDIRIMAPFKDLSQIIPEGDRIVIIPESDYNYLIDIVEPEEPEILAPHSYQIESTQYNGRVEQDGIRFKANYIINLVNPGWKQVQIISNSVVPSYATINNEPLSLSIIDNYYGFMTQKQGKKEVSVKFFVPFEPSELTYKRTLMLPVSQAAISTLELKTELKGSELWLDPGVLHQSQIVGPDKIFTAVIPPSDSISIEFYPETHRYIEEEVQKDAVDLYTEETTDEHYIDDEPEEVVIEETRVVSSARNLLYFKQGFMKGHSRFSLRVTGDEGIDKIRFIIPESYSITRVENRLINNWEVISENNEIILDITFNTALRGNVSINIDYEQELPMMEHEPYTLEEIIPLDVVSSDGATALGCLERYEITTDTAAEGYTPILPADFLSEWRQETPEKTPYAFRFLNHPNSLTLNITRPEDIALQTAVIDRVEAITMVSQEGQVFNRVVFEVRNNAQQFLKIKLPKIDDIESELWSSKVDGQPVRAGFDDDFDIYNLPIIRSPIVNGEPRSFLVEIIYCIDTNKALSSINDINLELAQAHLPVSRLLWYLFMPDGFRLVNPGGNLEFPVDRVTPQFLTEADTQIVVSKSARQHQQIILQQRAQQRSKEDQISRAGILPVNFNIPVTTSYEVLTMMQLEPEGAPPRIEGQLVNLQKDYTVEFQLIMILIGAIAGISVINIIRLSPKGLWIGLFLLQIVLVSLAIFINIDSADYLAQSGFVTSAGIYLLWLFFSWEPQTKQA